MVWLSKLDRYGYVFCVFLRVVLCWVGADKYMEFEGRRFVFW